MGLQAAANEAGASALSRSLRNIAKRLEQGDSLDDALSEQLSRRSAHASAAIRAGLGTGRLGQVLTELVRYQRFQHRLRSSLWASLSYPILLLVLLVIVLAFVFNAVVPQFATMFKEFGIELPAMTIWLVRLYELRWQSVLLSLAAIPVAAVLLRYLLGKSNWQLFLCTMPVFGQLIHWNGVAQFARLLPVFLRQSVPLPEALQLTSKGIRDANIALATRGLARQIEAGSTFETLLAESHRIPHTVSVIVGWGEQHDRLAESLELLAEFCEGRILRRTAWLTTVIPPLMFILIAATVAGVFLALFLPLVSLIEGLS